jgi:PLP dependent protein
VPEPVSGEDIAENVRSLRTRLDAAAHRARRDPASIRLVAVTKTKPAWMVKAARDAGCTVFGENYVQEALAKQDELAGLGAEWHLVGALQSNKAKHVVGRFALLHALDSAKLAAELDKRAAAKGVAHVDVLVEVNLAGEATKAGVEPGAVAALLDETRSLARVRVRGLMAMPPPEDGEANRPRFRALAALAAELRSSGRLAPDATELSMGTTSDFEAAVEEGATLVRVGTALFGPRAAKMKLENE